MTEAHFDQSLAAFQERSPFRPFTVVLGSGTRFEVDHPGVLIFRDGVAVFLGPGGTPILFDHEGVEQFVADLAGGPDAVLSVWVHKRTARTISALQPLL